MNRLVLPVLLGSLAFGCGKKPAPEAEAPTPAVAAAPAAPTEAAPAVRRGPDDSPEPVAPPDEPPPAPEEVAPSAPPAPAPAAAPELQALAAAYAERACVLKRQDRIGTAEIDKRHGFVDAADFARRFAAAAAADAAWAETTMASALGARCTPE